MECRSDGLEEWDGVKNLLRRKPWEDGILVVSSSGGEGEARRLFDGAARLARFS